MESELNKIESTFLMARHRQGESPVVPHPYQSHKKHIPQKHILLIDPDGDNLKLHTECLRYVEYQVSSVQTGFEALEILMPEIRTFPQLRNRILKLCASHSASFSKPVTNTRQTVQLSQYSKTQNSQMTSSPVLPDLIVLDLRLSDVSGLWLTRFLKENPTTSTIPILIFTALTLKHHESQSFEAGCNGFLGKPVSMKTFLSTIDQIFKEDHTIAPAKMSPQRQPQRQTLMTSVQEATNIKHYHLESAS
ncbi:MAG: response regulator [Cyanobacteria bacterium]|nr:response regulator [Cyanobacteriota bacterium]